MADVQTTHRWFGRLLFVVICFVVIFAQMMPLTTAPRQWAPPDILLALTLAWVVRRPELAPVTLIALVFFSADLLLQRPPGLWAGLVVIATEILRAKSPDFRALAFPFEWLSVTATLVGLFIAYRVIVLIMILPQTPVMLTLLQLTTTVIAYPAVVFLSYLAFGVNRPAMGEVDDRGKRL